MKFSVYIFRKTKKIQIQNCGFVALISSIITSVVLLLIITSASMTGFYGRSNALDYEFKERSTALAEACAQEALLKLTIDISYLGNEQIPMGDNSCQIRPISTSGGYTTIETQAIFQNSYTNMRVVLNSDTLAVISWDEIAVF